MGTIIKSVRISDKIAGEVEKLKGEQNFSQVVNKALVGWLQTEKRREEDTTVERALNRLKSDRVVEEEKLARLASKSAQRVRRKYRNG